MVAATKAQINATMAGGDGVHVFLDGKDFGVGFAFSNVMRQKIKQVPGAEYDNENGHWKVPSTSAKELCETVGDMREFVRCNGVQVKDVDAGKVVIFDFDKALNQVIGPVAGAKYDQSQGGWFVPADSKALIAKDGQVSYFEKAINEMRGLVVAIEKDRASIQNLAVSAANDRMVTPGIFYPKKDHSYTGPILCANGHYAAQLTGIENDTAFIALHRQIDLGQAVMKGDDLRIDYGVDNAVKVRTTEVFRQQQTERDNLTKLAEGKIDGAKVFNASAKDGKGYSGKVVEVTEHFVLQHIGREGFAIHERAKLRGEVAKEATMDVKYNKGVGMVNEKAKGREMAGTER